MRRQVDYEATSIVFQAKPPEQLENALIKRVPDSYILANDGTEEGRTQRNR